MTEDYIYNGHIITKTEFGCAHCVETFDTREEAVEHVEDEHN